jgi:hypothetical protein
MAETRLVPVIAVRQVRVPCPKADAVAVVQDLTTLPSYEQKVRQVSVEPGGDGVGQYTLTGKLAGLVPWRGTFHYVLHPDGFHSVDAEARRDGWEICGGYYVRAIGPDECEVVHYERYDLPAWLKPVRRLVAWYMRNSQRRELKIIHDLVVLRSAEQRARAGPS